MTTAALAANAWCSRSGAASPAAQEHLDCVVAFRVSMLLSLAFTRSTIPRKLMSSEHDSCAATSTSPIILCIAAKENKQMGERVALVSGGTGALGRVICDRLSKDGLKVVANCHPSDGEAARAWQRQLAAEGTDVALFPFDVADHETARVEIDRIQEDIGPIDVLVNAAGITRDAPLIKMTPAEWSAVLRTNLDSLYNTTHYVIPGMIERRFGQRGQFGQANYAAAKAGVHGFTMAVAREVARKGVTVNTVSPGYIRSPLVMAVPEEVRNRILEQIPIGRFGEPDEVAQAVSFLVADSSAYITGADLSVNGGYHMA
jgi:acetoacetyl-CoA reductase